MKNIFGFSFLVQLKIATGGWEEQPTPEARGGSREDQPHVQGAVAAQEGLEKLSHVEGQEGRRLGDTPHPR